MFFISAGISFADAMSRFERFTLGANYELNLKRLEFTVGACSSFPVQAVFM